MITQVKQTFRCHWQIHSLISATVALLALLLCQKASAVSWYDEINPHFAPSVPSAASGAVYYEFEFIGYSEGGADCVTPWTHVEGGTREFATLNGVKVIDRGVAEIISHTVYPLCGGNESLTHCLQSYDGIPSPSYIPDSDTIGCNYTDGDFYNGTWSSLESVLSLPCYQLTSVTDSGTNACGGTWWIRYTFPAYTPLCYYHESESCACNGGTAYPTVYGWSHYYKIEVVLDECASLPNPLPDLPGPIGGGGGEGAGIQAAFDKRISAGDWFNLAARLDGTVWSWGHNAYGQLGDGTTTHRLSPVQVTGLSGVTAVEAGAWHSLALRSDGTVWAWGRNQFGQLGDGTTTHRSTPVQVSGLTQIIAISGGGIQSYALESNGTVWAWGRNANGELGDGTTTDSLTPVQVSSLTGVTDVTAGYFHGLALKSDGTAWSWGYNLYGQLGDGTTTTRLTPVQVSNLSGISAISSGNGNHNLVLKQDGTVWAWGANSNGRLGDGTTTDRSAPVQTSGLAGMIAIGAANYHSLGVKNDGTTFAWGANSYGQLGDGTTTTRTTPVQTSGLTEVTAVAGGNGHSLSVNTNLTLHAWGRNIFGQLGDGTTTDRLTPVTVSGFGL